MDAVKKLLVKFRRLITFGFVGIINTAVDFGAFTAVRSLLGASPEVSQVVGYVAGIVCSFILNKTFTFRDSEGKLAPQILRFVIVNGCSLLVSVGLMSVLTNAGWNEYLVKIPVTVIVMIINFLGYKILVFQIKDKGEGGKGNE